MPTPGEQKALLFLAGVALLGGGVRLLGDEPPAPLPTPAERAGLAAQLRATDSAADARRAVQGATVKGSNKGRRKRRPSGERSSPARSDRSAEARPVDVDHAGAEELVALPGIGPALAARIVADREARGPFGSLEALDAVPGVGPALIKRLAPHVTFSGPRRPSTARSSGGGARASGRVVGLIGGRP